MKNLFNNLKFRYKLLLSMLFITTIALYFIVQISYSYFYRRNIQEVNQKATYSVTKAAASLSLQFQNLSTSTNLLMVRAPFPQMIQDINEGVFSGYSKYFSTATEETMSFLHNQDIVSNLLICGEDQIFYSPSSLGINEVVQKLLPENIYDYSAITIFPARSNTLFKYGTTVPISFPVYCNPFSKNVTYQDLDGCKRARLILLLDVDYIRAYLERMSNGYTYCMYIADQDGFPLDVTREKYPELFRPEIQQNIASVSDTDLELPFENDKLLLSVSPIQFCNLKVVHITKHSSLIGDIKQLKTFFIFSWLACLTFAALLSLSISHVLTKRFKDLGTAIELINQNNYREKIEFQHSDEISLLGSQLNHMYDTIQRQLEQIKEEEHKKALAEIQMMSEQINPHFLYNTLECIHFQVLNQHSEAAGDMLESLGRYLRITLSVGSAKIPIKKEVEHVTSYVDIINRHSSSGIRFQCHVEPKLEEYKIVKRLLQPLVENSIKHGFNGSVTGLELIPPAVTVAIELKDEETIRIEVSDNGKGIDIPIATSCLTVNSHESQKHFGLQNIYKRLITCYGDKVSVSFSSIPYLKNSVIIEIPYINS